MFDGLEMGLFPLVAGPALAELLGSAAAADAGRWFSVIIAVFLIGAATGGVFFGWLGDRIGRVRAMSLSVFTYALFTGLCGFATEAWHVAVLRFIASLGMGGEWALGVALVMEVWPDRSRAWLAGVIGAAANFGYMAIAIVGLGLTAILADLHDAILSVGIGPETADWLASDKNSGWRILMMIGALPAILTFLIRLFVPESHRWQEENRKGATSHWQTRDLLGVAIGAVAGCGLVGLWAVRELDMWIRVSGSVVAVTVITAGYLYPIVRYFQRAQAPAMQDASGVRHTGTSIPRIVTRLLLAAGLSGVALLGTWGSVQSAPTHANNMVNERKASFNAVAGSAAACTGPAVEWAGPGAKELTQMCSAMGAIVGCVLAALAGGWLGRRLTYAGLCVGSMLAIYGLFQLNDDYGTSFLIWAFIAGGITAAFYGWLPLYLPELFPTRVRATGQGFGFNFGRVLAAIGVLQLANIMKQLNVGWQDACTVMSLIYIVGLALIWIAPETKGRSLPA
jgi:MFS family permease